jgi:predicted dehydrogenase
MGVHAIDGMIDLGGEIERCSVRAFRRVVQVDSDDTTSMLFRMKNGASGYLGHDHGDGARASASRCLGRRARCASKA